MEDEITKDNEIRDTRIAGASKGGKKRAENQTPEERRELAIMAAEARWSKQESDDSELASLPIAEYTGILQIGDMSIHCAVLNDGRRILSERSVAAAFGAKRGGSHWQRLKEAPEYDYRPLVISAANLSNFISPSLRIALSHPVRYQTKTGRVYRTLGMEAILLTEVCEVLLKARRAKTPDGKRILTPSQEKIAAQAEILQGGLARTGIIALVDEATGFQYVREQDELTRLLKKYISEALMPWSLRFPQEFYREIFRLRGWEWNPNSVKRPKRVGKDTIDIIYDRLPEKVLNHLREKSPEVKPGYRRYHLHRFLTEDIGHPHLDRLVAISIALMKLSKTWASFKRKLDIAVPKPKPQTDMTDLDSSFKCGADVYDEDDDE